MCLFDVLCSLAKEMDLKIYPVHVNHLFRPGAAEEDQAYVESICRERGFPCQTFIYDCNRIAAEQKLTSEEAGRKVRYEAFSKVADQIEASGIERSRIAIAVAQNADDQCETILFRILRGAGIDGISGIAYKRYDEKRTAIIRPLLDISRDDIEKYCIACNLSPRRDHTNEEPIYARNKIRLELLPFLKEQFNPNIMHTIHRLGNAAATDKAYLRQQAEMAYKTALAFKSVKQVVFHMEQLKSLHLAIRLRVYNIALDTIGLKENITSGHLEGIEKVIFSASPSASFDLPFGFRVYRRYDTLVFQREASINASAGSKHDEDKGALRVTVTEVLQVNAKRADETKNVSLQGTFSFDALSEVYGPDVVGNITLRKRENGDYMMIRINGTLHRKKIQDIFVDEKIPKKQRDDVLLAAVGKEVLWILPHRDFASQQMREKGRFSADYKVNGDRDKLIIVLEYLS